jgi:hypothetical protein
VTYAAVPDRNGVIHACFQKHGGKLRVIDTEASLPKKCRKNEETLTWNQRGPEGPVASPITGAQVQDDSLTGADIAESTLDLPPAKSARSLGTLWHVTLEPAIIVPPGESRTALVRCFAPDQFGMWLAVGGGYSLNDPDTGADVTSNDYRVTRAEVSAYPIQGTNPQQVGGRYNVGVRNVGAVPISLHASVDCARFQKFDAATAANDSTPRPPDIPSP